MAMDEPIGNQIEATVNQLTELVLLDLARKYNLPTTNFGLPPAPPPLTSKIKTDLFSIMPKKPIGDDRQVLLTLTLEMEAIDQLKTRYATKRCAEPDWAFLAYVKEGTFTLASLKQYNNLEELSAFAEFATQNSVSFPLPMLKPGILYSALFVVAIDTDEKIGLEGNSLIPMHIPTVPSIDQITELKGKLDQLLNINGKKNLSAEQKDITGSRFQVLRERFDRRIAEVRSSNIPEGDRTAIIETISVKFREDACRLYSSS